MIEMLFINYIMSAEGEYPQDGDRRKKADGLFTAGKGSFKVLGQPRVCPVGLSIGIRLRALNAIIAVAVAAILMVTYEGQVNVPLGCATRWILTKSPRCDRINLCS